MELSCYRVRTTIYFEICCKKSTTECHRIMCSTFGTNVVSHDSVKVWYRKLQNKDHKIQKVERSRWPTNVGEVSLWKFVEDDPYSTTRELTKELCVSATLISRTMHRINLMRKFNCGCLMSRMKKMKTGVFRPVTIFLYINTRIKFCTGLSLVTKSGFTSTTEAKKRGSLLSVNMLTAIIKLILCNQKIMPCIGCNCLVTILKESLKKR